MEKTGICLWYDNRAEEAVNLYKSVLPDVTIGRVARYGKDTMGPEGQVMTIEFAIAGRQYLALNGGPHFRFSEATSIMVYCDDQAEVDRYWNGLIANGGEESQCGWLKDPYGLSWQITPRMLIDLNTDPDPARRYRANQAMLKMRKIIIADIEAAANGL